MNALQTRKCQACGRLIKGRVDKKFCDDNCRNSHNNRRRSESHYNTYIRSINNTLWKNRKILESILATGEETAKANKEKLERLGFQFKYLTHTYLTRDGKRYYYCYDYGYLPLENDWYLIVKRKDK